MIRGITIDNYLEKKGGIQMKTTVCITEKSCSVVTESELFYIVNPGSPRLSVGQVQTL